MKSLVVQYNSREVGNLFQDESGKMSFRYDNRWISEGFAISISLPLQEEIFSEQECRPFFEGLLPEGTVRDEIARNLGISARSDFALLREIGGDCAGAISIGSSQNESFGGYKELIEGKRLIEALSPLNGKPLLAGEKDVRLSIAGSQRKLPVIYENGEFFIPHGNIPTTHIIKPEIAGIEGSVDNERYCMALAKKIGLSVPNFEILQFHKGPPGLIKNNGPEFNFLIKSEDIGVLHQKYLVIERYDREKENDRTVRLHQEDLCQATRVPSENKYQKDGGPGFRELFTITRDYSFQPALDVMSIIRIALFNYIIGNADAHGKNFSFLFTKDGIKLAPFYDLLSTEVYPNLSAKMAMKIGGKYHPKDVFRRHWHELAEENSIGSKLMDEEIEHVSKTVFQWYELVAKQWFGTYRFPKTIDDILKLIRKKIKLLERK
jgi:serine/threonine-protein kinase HipA